MNQSKVKLNSEADAEAGIFAKKSSGILLSIARCCASIISVVRFRAVDRSEDEGRSRDRMRRAILTSLAAAISRVISMATPLITIPVALGYLGHELFGLWMTITSFVGMFIFADLGLGNGLLTALSRTQGKRDIEMSRSLISTTMFLLLAMAFALGVVFAIIWPFLPWKIIFNTATPVAAEAVGGVVGAYVICFLINLPLTTVQRAQMALQEGFLSHIWLCCGSIINIGVVFAAIGLKLSVTHFVFAVSITPVCITGLNWLFFFVRLHPELRPTWRIFSWGQGKLLLSSGLSFLLLSILTTVGMSADNFIIARFCGLENVTNYAVPARIAVLLNAGVMIICSPMWAANGEALARGDIDWVWRNTIRLIKLSAGFTLALAVLLVLLGRPLFHLWLGSSFEVSIFLLAGFGLNSVCLAAASPLFMLLNGANVVYPQVLIFLIFTPLVIILKMLFLRAFGFAGVSWAGALTYLFIVLPAVTFLAKKVIQKHFDRISQVPPFEES